jgi:hypothetical protein
MQKSSFLFCHDAMKNVKYQFVKVLVCLTGMANHQLIQVIKQCCEDFHENGEERGIDE